MVDSSIFRFRNTVIYVFFVIAFQGLANDCGSVTSEGDNEPFEKVLIYWDTSLSMAGRNLEVELELLSAYFESLGSTEVEFIPFDHRLERTSNLSVVDGEISSFKSLISGLTYDGVALFKLLDLNEDAYATLIFSDGVGVMDDLHLPEGKDIFLINSLPAAQTIGRRTYHRNYLDLAELGLGGVLERLGVVGAMASSDLPTAKSPDVEKTDFRIEGVVFDQSRPLENATIQVKGEDTGVVSGKDGRFHLEASIGDILMIGYLGMENQEYRITGDQVIEFYLNIEQNQLDGVVLKSKAEGPDAKNTITTAYGEKSEDQIGYTVQDVEGENFEGQANISDATRGKIISYNYSQNDDLSQIQLRQVQTFGAGTKNPLIVVDDIPLGTNNSATGGRTLSTWHIDPNNVEKITVLRGLAATNKYGMLARGGAILIYTKTRVGATAGKDGQANSALVKGNTYTETVASITNAPKGDYLKEFKKAKSVEEAYELYMTQRVSHMGDFEYFIDVSKYMVKWGNADLSKRILLNILELNPNEVEYLRFAGMLLQDRKDFNLALEVYEHILLLKPGESQSYRDLALILGESQQYQKSLDMYRKMKDGSYPSVNFEGLRKPLNSEMKRLILLHRNKLDTQGLSSHYQTPMNYDVRVVVEYNDRDAEFDLQFVNPQKKFFVWSHRKFENSERIDQEKIQGFNTEEFFLIDAEPGKWQVNIESPKQDSRDPLVLRYTVYRNYGTKAESSQSKTLILNTIEGKYLLGIIKI